MASNYHTFKASGQQFEVTTGYTLKKPIGHGAYGVVISAFDKDSNRDVAIKKVSHAFEDAIDAKRILREILLMKKLVHENVIRIIDIIPPPPTAEDFDDIYIVQDLMETDLHRIIYSRQALTIEHVQYFVYQILRGLRYIHSANVIHRDLKPSNLLVNGNCDLKVCDFGLARGLEDEQTGALTEYVVTRWYRAPEIMLACQEYSKAIDMWSVGCIFAELLARKPLFPGEDYIAQLRLICEKLGRPSDETLNFVTSERAKKFMISLPKKAPVPMADLFPAHTEEHEALDLLSKMLSFDPSSRISIDAALEHPFLTSLHNADDEPVADFTFSFDFENEELSREKVRELIWDELRTYHPSIAESPPSSATPRRRASQMLADNKANGKSDAKSDVDDKKVSANSTSETDDDREEKESDLSSSKKRHIPPIAPKK